MNYRYLNSPIGEILVAGDEDGLKYVGFPAGRAGWNQRPHGPWTNRGSMTLRINWRSISPARARNLT